MEQYMVVLDIQKNHFCQHTAFRTSSLFKFGVSLIILLCYLILLEEIPLMHCLLPVEI